MEQASNNFQLGASFKTIENVDLNSALSELEQSGISFIHLDFFDGLMVKSHGLSPEECLRIRKLTKLPLEAHLMEIDLQPMQFYRDLGIDRVLIHHESSGNKEVLLASAKQSGMEAGIALKPGTPHNLIEIIHPELIDMVLVLGTKSGSGGSLYDEQTPSRVRQVVSIYKGPIEVNSGIITTPDQPLENSSIGQLYAAGARRFSLERGLFDMGLSISDAVKLNMGALAKAYLQSSTQ